MAATTETSTETKGEAHSTAAGEAAGVTAGTAAHGGEHGADVFPPMDTTKYPSQIFWLVVFFGLLYWLMKRILPRIGAILETRKARIDGDLARAQALKDETESAIKAYEKSLGDARASANDIAKATREKISLEVDAEQAKVNASLASKISDAEGLISKARAKAMESVEAIAAEAADDIVKSLAGVIKSTRKVAKA
jgi:F-type H+-transporting ATPase subunit b